MLGEVTSCLPGRVLKEKTGQWGPHCSMPPGSVLGGCGLTYGGRKQVVDECGLLALSC